MHVVFDLDGTLALNEHRVHHIRGPKKDYDAFFAACPGDLPNWPVIHVFNALRWSNHHVEIWSGRSDQVMYETVQWLDTCSISEAYLKRMRRAGDHTPDVDLKRAWLNKARADGWQPDVVYDDRDCVVAMWREEGIPCFQVAPGPF